MKVNLKTTNETENAAATPNCHQRGQRTVNGIIGNTSRGIVVDQTLDPDSNNPVSNKPVSTALAALAGKIDAALQKPTGLTKTKLVGVGTNGQDNIEIGDNLTLANGKLSATGGGGGDAFDVIRVSEDETTYTGTITGTKPVLMQLNLDGIYQTFLYQQSFVNMEGNNISTSFRLDFDNKTISYILTNGNVRKIIKNLYYNHFITMKDSASNVVLYLTIYNTSEDTFTADTLASYLAGKKVLANGNLHGLVPTYIAGEVGVIKVYYRTPGDSNINPTPDEYQDLSSFTISDLVI